MKKPRGLYEFRWASDVYEALSLSYEDLEKKIKETEKEVTEIKKTDSVVGLSNVLETLHVYRIIRDLRKEEIEDKRCP